MSNSKEHVTLPPCRETKCISYPSCLTKKVIGCIILREYYDDMINKYRPLANRNAKTFSIIHTVLPKLVTIRARNVCV